MTTVKKMQEKQRSEESLTTFDFPIIIKIV